MADTLDTVQLDMLGAPFPVHMDRSISVTRGADGEIEATHIPEFAAMLCTLAAARAAHRRRLSGEELRFLRRSAMRTTADMGLTIGRDAAGVEAAEDGIRPLDANEERLARIAVMTACCPCILDGPMRLQAFLEWIVTDPVKRLHPVEPLEFRMRHSANAGWTCTSLMDA